jgi:cell division transport system permease protein
MVIILYLMISNSIRLTIYARRDLVAHMQVVGATDFFIKMPFILEGILQALVGGILYIMIIGIIRLALMRFPIYWGPASLPLLIIFIGVVFGWFGSARAVRKFLV